MSPDDFIANWQGVTLTERASAQEQVIHLCRMLGGRALIEANSCPSSPARVVRYVILTRLPLLSLEEVGRSLNGVDGWSSAAPRRPGSRSPAYLQPHLPGRRHHGLS